MKIGFVFSNRGKFVSFTAVRHPQSSTREGDRLLSALVDHPATELTRTRRTDTRPLFMNEVMILSRCTYCIVFGPHLQA